MEKASRTVRFPQLAKEPLLTSPLRANPENRIIAKALDFVLGLALQGLVSLVSPLFYFVVGFLYWGTIDTLGRGQSPGKWIVGLHTIEVGRGQKITFYQGLVRNILFLTLSCLFYLEAWYWSFLMIPVYLGLILEGFFIFRIRSGLRVGDVLSATRVADFKDQHTQFVEQFLKDEDYSSEISP